MSRLRHFAYWAINTLCASRMGTRFLVVFTLALSPVWLITLAISELRDTGFFEENGAFFRQSLRAFRTGDPRCS